MILARHCPPNINDGPPVCDFGDASRARLLKILFEKRVYISKIKKGKKCFNVSLEKIHKDLKIVVLCRRSIFAGGTRSQ